jgi:hypothetical protein
MRFGNSRCYFGLKVLTEVKSGKMSGAGDRPESASSAGFGDLGNTPAPCRIGSDGLRRRLNLVQADG